MKRRVKTGQGPRHITPAGRSVFRELFSEVEAEELEIRAELLRGLRRWFSGSAMTQAEAARVLGVTQARVSDIKRGKINKFSVDLLVRLAARKPIDFQHLARGSTFRFSSREAADASCAGSRLENLNPSL